MSKSVLSWKQVVGLEPISKEEFVAAVDEGIEDAKKGDTISLSEDVRYPCFSRA